jgi:hypothetical protein
MAEHFASGSAVVLVLEYMVADLLQVMKAMQSIGARMSARAVQACMWMMLQGVRRRIKPTEGGREKGSGRGKCVV